MTTDDALVTALRSDVTVSSLVSAVGHGMVPPGTPRPYIIVRDLIDDTVYAFGNREVSTTALYHIEIICQDTETEAAQTVARRIQEAIAARLQDADLAIEGRTGLNLRRERRLQSGWDMGEGDSEMDYIEAHEWTLTSCPAP